MLNIAGPWEVLGHANDVLGRAAYELEACGAGGPDLTTRHGLILGGIRPLPEDPHDLPDLVLVVGPNGVLIWGNSTAERLFGTTIAARKGSITPGSRRSITVFTITFSMSLSGFL